MNPVVVFLDTPEIVAETAAAAAAAFAAVVAAFAAAVAIAAAVPAPLQGGLSCSHTSASRLEARRVHA